MRVAFLGGSFNPPHAGHQLACLLLLEMEGFEQVWLVPCYRHAFSKQLAAFSHRVQMCRRMARPFGERVVVEQIERELLDEGVNRTAATLDLLAGRHPQDDITLVVGSDLIGELDQWKDFQRIVARHQLLVLPRTGYSYERGPWRVAGLRLPEVSSTQLRRRLAAGQSIDGLVPTAVAEYISLHGLYATNGSGD